MPQVVGYTFDADLEDASVTFGWLDSMLAIRDSYTHRVRVDPVFDFLSRDPRYREWESRSKLPPLARPAR
jgi:hypothetical protein